jgi:hypothetical protein
VSDTFSAGTLEVASGATLNVAGTFQLGGAAVSATAPQLNELVGGGATTLHSHAAGDADTLDTLDSLQFLRSDVDDTCTGQLTFTGAVKGGHETNKGVIYIAPTGVTAGTNDTMFGIYNTNTSNADGWDVMAFGEGGSLTVNGPLQGGCKFVPVGYNRFGNSAASSAEIDSRSDLFVTDDLEVGDELIWHAVTRYYSVSAADFIPQEDYFTYVQTAVAIYKDSGDANSQGWYAAVHLPDGATVTSFSVWYYDSSSENLTVYLRRRAWGVVAWNQLAEVASSGTGGEGSGGDILIDYEIVSNFTHIYYIYFQFPTANTYNTLQFREARIGYTTTGP